MTDILKRLMNKFKKRHPDLEGTGGELKDGTDYKSTNRSLKYLDNDLHELAAIKEYMETLSYIDTKDSKEQLVLYSNEGPTWATSRAQRYVNMAVCALSPLIQHHALHFIEEDMKVEARRLAEVAGPLLTEACCDHLSSNLADEEEDLL